MKQQFNLEKLIHTRINSGWEYITSDKSVCVWGASYFASTKAPLSNGWAVLAYRLLTGIFDKPLTEVVDGIEYDLMYSNLTPQLAKMRLINYLVMNGYVSDDQLASANPMNFVNNSDKLNV